MHLVSNGNGFQLVAAIVLAGIILFTGCSGRFEQRRSVLHGIYAGPDLSRSLPRGVVAITV